MKKKIFSRQGLVVSLSLAAIILMAYLYLFQYIPANESYLKARRFRALERTQTNLQNKLQNSFSFLETQLKSYIDPVNSDTAKMLRYLDGLDENAPFSLGKLTYLPLDTTLRSKGNILIFDDDSIRCFSRLIRSNHALELAMSYDIESFVRSSLPRNLFDEFVLIRNDKILFASFPTGSQKIAHDTSLNFSASLPVSSEGVIKLAGQDYRIFLQPLKLDTSNWVLGGLLQHERFSRERNQFDPKKVLTTITIGIVLLILLPWIKLFYMGSRDRLTHTDGFLSYLVAMFIMCMLFFVFARTLPRQDHYKPLQVLSDSISRHFESQMDAALNLLKQMDTAIARDASLQRDMVNFCGNSRSVLTNGFAIKKSFTEEEDKAAKSKADSLKNAYCGDLCQIKLNHLYWLDSSGMEIYNWSSGADVRPHQNFYDRPYFKNFLKKNPGRDTYTEPLISWTTGDFRTVISKRSALNSALVAAISFNLPSMENHILPEGYLAMIINWRGQVVYDTEESDNLNEFLTEEFPDSSRLKSAIYAGTVEKFTSNYLGSKYRVLFTPLEGQYFLLLLQNQSFENSRDINAFSFALLMYAIFFAIVMIQFACMLSLFRRPSGLKYKIHWIDALFPSMALKPAYSYASIGNIFMILILLCFTNQSLMLHVYLLLSAVAINAIYINLVCAFQHIKTNDPGMADSKYKNAGIVAVFLVIYNLLAFNILDGTEPKVLVVFQLIVISGLSLMLYLYRQRPADAHKNSTDEKAGEENKIPGAAKSRFIQNYTWMAVSRVIITSGIPVLFFYMDAYNYEQSLQNRHAQKYFAYQYSKALYVNSHGAAVSRQNIFIDSSLIYRYDTTVIQADNSSIVKKSYVSEEFYDAVRFLDDTISMANNNLFKNIVANDEGRFNDDNSYSRKSYALKKPIYVASKIDRFGLFTGLSTDSWRPWALLMILLIAFYHIIQLILKKIFGIQFTEEGTDTDIHNKVELENQAKWSINRAMDKPGCMLSKQKNTVIVATPGAGTQEAIAKIDADRKSDPRIHILDLHRALAAHTGEVAGEQPGANGFDEAIHENYTCLLISHFEYLLHDFNLHAPLVALLEHWHSRSDSSVCIVSAIHPADIPELIQDQLALLEKCDAEKAADSARNLNKLEAILGNFTISFMGLSVLADGSAPNSPELRFLEQELRYGDFLHRYYQFKKNEIDITNITLASGATENLPAGN